MSLRAARSPVMPKITKIVGCRAESVVTSFCMALVYHISSPHSCHIGYRLPATKTHGRMIMPDRAHRTKLTILGITDQTADAISFQMDHSVENNVVIDSPIKISAARHAEEHHSAGKECTQMMIL